MSRSSITKTYECLLGCNWGSCSGHEVTLELSHTSDIFTYRDDRGKETLFDIEGMRNLIAMATELLEDYQ
jgi:hypothetical protein